MKNFALHSLLILLLAQSCRAAGASITVQTIIHSEPLHRGRIDPMLFGNFVELLDDVVPGMWSELLNDRSFEGILPASNWCYYDGSKDICDRPWETNETWTLDSENPFNGRRSARLRAGASPAHLTQAGLGVRKGLSYSFSGYFRGDASLRVVATIKFLLPTGDWLTLASAELPRASDSWEKRTVELVSKGTTDEGVFELSAEGSGSLWADKLSLMPEDNQEGWRRDVVEAIREVRPSIIRWGGSSVDPGKYRWKEGIGDRDRRTPWRNQNWGRLDPNDVGIDEFCRFCELTHAEPLVCVSFADGSESAGELVAYCNAGPEDSWGAKRAADGHPAPYHVRYWQVGNEIDGNDPVYLNQIAAFIAAMKKADPAVQIMTSFPTQQLLNRVGKDIAFVCPHHYTTDLDWCDRDFNRIEQMIAHTPGCKHLQVGVTEWNIDAGSWGLGRARQQTLGSALLNARYLHLLMRHSDRVKIACRSNLANSYCGAILETSASGTGILRRPSFNAMKLYATHTQPVPLWLETFNDRLDLFACATDDRNKVEVFAINLEREPVSLSLGFEGFAGTVRIKSADALCDVEQRGQPDVMNHWNDPGRVSIIPVQVEGGTVHLPGLSATAISGVRPSGSSEQ